MVSSIYLSNNNNAAEFFKRLGYAGASYSCLQTPLSTYYALESSQQVNNVVAKKAFLLFSLRPASTVLFLSVSSSISSIILML